MPRQRDRNAIPSDSRKAAAGSVRFAIKVAYDGAEYQGFQSQRHGLTIQDQIEGRLEKMVKRPLRIFGWGRTDSGVHARGAVITVDLTEDEVKRLAAARNEVIDGRPSELSSLAAKSLHSALKEFKCKGGVGSISAISAVPVPSDFDPRYSSLWKRYVYYISSGDHAHSSSPFLYRYVWHVNRSLDVDNMIDAASLLSGEHNFQWISVSQEGELRDPVRVLQLTVETIDPGPFFDISTKLIKISATCDFFLYRMMRRIVGILFSIGSGRADMEALAACLREHDEVRSANNPQNETFAQLSATIPLEFLHTAPAKGLCLDHVEYDIPI